MIAQPARVVCGRDKAGAQRVHFLQGGNHARIAEIVSEFPPCEAGAAGRFHCDKAVILFPAQLFSHEGGNQSAQIGTAARAADDDIRHNAVFIQRGFRFQTDNGLMQQHLVKHAAQHITVTLRMGGYFHRFGNGAAQAARGAGMFRQNLPADFRGIGRGRGNGRPVGTHHFPAERLLFVRTFYHVNFTVKPQVSACHGKRRAPLPCAGFCGYAL